MHEISGVRECWSGWGGGKVEQCDNAVSKSKEEAHNG